MMKTSRRTFFKAAGMLAGLAAVAGCGSSSSSFAGTFTGDGGDLGQGDTAILNTFFAYKQLMLAIHDHIAAAGGGALTAGELEIISQMRAHENQHFLRLQRALGGLAIPILSGFDFTSVPVSDRDRVLTRLQDFEDVGVVGWNGSTRYLGDARNIALLNEIASVDARHSAVIRELLEPGSENFAGGNAVSRNGVERLSNPYFVFSVVRSYDPRPELDSGDLP